MMRWLALCLVVSCTQNKTEEKGGPPTAERGKQVYMSSCIACHSADPGKDGAIGPAIKGSSKELLEARVIKGTYPDGYKPKRDTKNMVPLPHLADKIDDLVEFLK